MPFRDIPVPTLPCPQCARPVEQGSEVCPTCRSPIDAGHYARMVLTLEPAQKRARRWLAICAWLDGAGFLMTFAAAGGDLSKRTAGQLVMTLFFAGAWALARRWPLGAPLVVSGFFAMSEVAGLVMLGPMSLISGVLVKVLLFTALVRGVIAGYEIRDLRGEAKPRDRALLIAFVVAATALGIVVGLALSTSGVRR
jgi:RNA polymerase subunit RPABC4/transcription elongation factor Spt4